MSAHEFVGADFALCAKWPDNENELRARRHAVVIKVRRAEQLAKQPESAEQSKKQTPESDGGVAT